MVQHHAASQRWRIIVGLSKKYTAYNSCRQGSAQPQHGRSIYQGHVKKWHGPSADQQSNSTHRRCSDISPLWSLRFPKNCSSKLKPVAQAPPHTFAQHHNPHRAADTCYRQAACTACASCSSLACGGLGLGLGGLISQVHQATEGDAGVVGQAHLARLAAAVAVGAVAQAQVLQGCPCQLGVAHAPVSSHA